MLARDSARTASRGAADDYDEEEEEEEEAARVARRAAAAVEEKRGEMMRSVMPECDHLRIGGATLEFDGSANVTLAQLPEVAPGKLVESPRTLCPRWAGQARTFGEEPREVFGTIRAFEEPRRVGKGGGRSGRGKVPRRGALWIGQRVAAFLRIPSGEATSGATVVLS
ncbi:hypothetical protein KM043_000935 [Ampulex compressa]|nr:hypothetical protein KM043_000935 [Ampulex compressa]